MCLLFIIFSIMDRQLLKQHGSARKTCWTIVGRSIHCACAASVSLIIPMSQSRFGWSTPSGRCFWFFVLKKCVCFSPSSTGFTIFYAWALVCHLLGSVTMSLLRTLISICSGAQVQGFAGFWCLGEALRWWDNETTYSWWLMCSSQVLVSKTQKKPTWCAAQIKFAKAIFVAVGNHGTKKCLLLNCCADNYCSNGFRGVECECQKMLKLNICACKTTSGSTGWDCSNQFQAVAKYHGGLQE